VANPDTWPEAPALEGRRIRLQPLRVEHAQEMAPLLDDPGLHAFTGGKPPNLAELRERYRRQVVGHSPDSAQRWLNWIIRRLDDGRAVGTVQATVTEEAGLLTAEVAWVIATAHQGHGYAQEAAKVMVAWLRRQGIVTLVAHVHPDHAASAAVARSVGLAPTVTVVDGEARWEG
jgi:RimJ/RimL family protein N-acetyltransferase